MAKSGIVIQLHCKNSCVFCNPLGIRKKFNKEELKKIESNLLQQACHLKKRGFNEVEISGYDPIEYEKIAHLVKRLKKDMKFELVLLLTHGRDLHNLKLVKELEAARLDEIKIPLYGSKASIHDSITQAKGSFKETLEGIKNLKKYAPDIHIMISSLIIKHNYKDIINIFSLAFKYTPDINFSIPCLPEHLDFRKIAVSFKEMRPYLVSLLNLNERKRAFLTITDIPFCVFGFYRANIFMTRPSAVAEPFSYPERFRTNIPNVPSYRIKTKLKICDKCSLNRKCDGFYSKYVDLFNLSYLKPL